MRIVRRLLSAFTSSRGGGRRSTRRRGSGGGLMSLVSRFLGSSRGRRSTRI